MARLHIDTWRRVAIAILLLLAAFELAGWPFLVFVSVFVAGGLLEHLHADTCGWCGARWALWGGPQGTGGRSRIRTCWQHRHVERYLA